jgi:hypothetical protein
LKKFNLMNSKGISIIFLVIAMLLMVTIGYVFSYLIPTKQKSVRFPIYSTKAFYIAQSGVEFGFRYCSNQGWRGATDNGVYDINRLNGISRPLGNGTFTITYNNAVGDILTSTGQISSSTENRMIRVSNFSPFLRLLFVTSPLPYRNPYWSTPTSRARFYIRNVRSTNVILNAFSASWTQNNPQRRISRVYIGGTEKYRGNYNSGSGIANFNRGGPTYSINPGVVYLVEIRWNNNVNNGRDVFITFYSTAGDGYAFNLDSAGDGL